MARVEFDVTHQLAVFPNNDSLLELINRGNVYLIGSEVLKGLGFRLTGSMYTVLKQLDGSGVNVRAPDYEWNSPIPLGHLVRYANEVPEHDVDLCVENLTVDDALLYKLGPPYELRSSRMGAMHIRLKTEEGELTIFEKDAIRVNRPIWPVAANQEAHLNINNGQIMAEYDGPSVDELLTTGMQIPHYDQREYTMFANAAIARALLYSQSYIGPHGQKFCEPSLDQMGFMSECVNRMLKEMQTLSYENSVAYHRDLAIVLLGMLVPQK